MHLFPSIRINLIRTIKLLLLGCLLFKYVSAEENLQIRNTYNVQHHAQSEHFVVWFSDEYAASQMQHTLDTLETIWQKMIVELGYPRPHSTSEYKFNVYIGDGGVAAVPFNGYVTAATKDRSFQLIIIIAPDFLDTDERAFKRVLTHEFFHVVQEEYNSRIWQPESEVAWFMEASAAWVNIDVWSNSVEAVSSVAGYAFYPEYPLDYRRIYDLNRPFNLLMRHHYGIAIFLQFLTEEVADRQLIKLFMEEMVELHGAGGVPITPGIHILRDVLEEHYGIDLAQAYSEFIAKNVTWDYAHGEYFEQSLQLYPDFTSHRPSITQQGLINHWQDSTENEAPYRWGANYVQLTDINATQTDVHFHGIGEGTQNGSGVWQATAVAVTDGGPIYYPMAIQTGEVVVQTIDTSDVNELWLSVSVSSDSDNFNERFNYQYQFSQAGQGEQTPSQWTGGEVVTTPPPAPATTTPPPQTTSESGGGTLGISIGWLVVLISLRSRRICASAMT